MDLVKYFQIYIPLIRTYLDKEMIDTSRSFEKNTRMKSNAFDQIPNTYVIRGIEL